MKYSHSGWRPEEQIANYRQIENKSNDRGKEAAVKGCPRKRKSKTKKRSLFDGSWGAVNPKVYQRAQKFIIARLSSMSPIIKEAIRKIERYNSSRQLLNQLSRLGLISRPKKHPIVQKVLVRQEVLLGLTHIGSRAPLRFFSKMLNGIRSQKVARASVNLLPLVPNQPPAASQRGGYSCLFKPKPPTIMRVANHSAPSLPRSFVRQEVFPRMVNAQNSTAATPPRVQTPLIIAAYQCYQQASPANQRQALIFFQNLLKNPAVDINARDSYGRTLLHHLALNNDVENIENLSNVRAEEVDVTIEDRDGKTALDVMIKEENREETALVYEGEERESKKTRERFLSLDVGDWDEKTDVPRNQFSHKENINTMNDTVQCTVVFAKGYRLIHSMSASDGEISLPAPVAQPIFPIQWPSDSGIIPMLISR